jgi:hypothetical protein
MKHSLIAHRLVGFCLKTIVSSVFLICGAGVAGATTYYVDYSAANDSANGTSTSTPWKYCPGDARAAAGHALSSGDTIYFKLGVTYSGPGVASRDIIRSVAPNVTYTVLAGWGTGRARFNSVGDQSIFSISHSGCNILGLTTAYEMYFTGASLVNQGIFFAGSSQINGGSVKFCEFDSLGSSSFTQGHAIKVGDGSLAGEILNLEIAYNYMHNCAGYATKISAGAGSSHDNLVHDNIMKDNCIPYSEHLQANFSSNAGNGAYGNSFYNNTLSMTTPSSTVDGIEANNSPNKIYGNTFTGFRYAINIDPSYNTNKYGVIEIYGNLIKNQTERGINFGTTSTTKGYVRAYNNLFINNGSYVVNFSANADDNQFYFNTFYQTGGHTLWIQNGATGNIIKNNIVFTTGDAYNQASSTYTANTEDSNCFYRASGTLVVVGGASYTVSQLASYRTAASPNGARTLFSNPLLNNPPTDLTETLASPTIDAGVDVGIYVDYAGLVRPQGPARDMGAYEFAVNGGAPKAPTGFRLATH